MILWNIHNLVNLFFCVWCLVFGFVFRLQKGAGFEPAPCVSAFIVLLWHSDILFPISLVKGGRHRNDREISLPMFINKRSTFYFWLRGTPFLNVNVLFIFNVELCYRVERREQAPAPTLSTTIGDNIGDFFSVHIIT